MDSKIKTIKNHLSDIYNNYSKQNKKNFSNKKKINSKIEEILFLLRKMKNMSDSVEEKTQLSRSILNVTRELNSVKANFSKNEKFSDLSKDLDSHLKDLKNLLKFTEEKEEE
jgi:hypothetical protein